jgi:hypothetical protein
MQLQNPMSDITAISPPAHIIPGTREYLIWYRGMVQADRVNAKRIRIWYLAWLKGERIPAPPTEAPNPKDRNTWPRWAKLTADLAMPDDKGVGDVVARLASRVGGDAYKRLRKSIGWPCKCNQRQDALNARYPL